MAFCVKVVRTTIAGASVVRYNIGDIVVFIGSFKNFISKRRLSVMRQVYGFLCFFDKINQTERL